MGSSGPDDGMVCLIVQMTIASLMGSSCPAGDMACLMGPCCPDDDMACLMGSSCPDGGMVCLIVKMTAWCVSWGVIIQTMKW